jgi:transcriptional regulator of acetoin/glycerol metabolism
MQAAASGSVEPAKPDGGKTLEQMREAWIGPQEKQYVLGLLDACGGKVDAAAKKAGVNRVTFYRLMKKHGVKLRSVVSTASPR